MKVEYFTMNSVTYTIHIGENKQDNWDIIDGSNPYSVWFHVANTSSSHVILHLQDDTIKIKDIPKQVLKRCACLCKSHSSSKSLKKVVIHYTSIGNIQKTKIVGQVLLLNEPKKIII